MKLGVISDIHSSIVALEKVLDEIEAELVVCAGDLVGYYLDPGEVIDRVKEGGITCVRGNHDDALVNWPPRNFNPVARKALELNREKLGNEQLSFLEQLPVRREMDVGGRKVLVVHGSPEEPYRYVYPRDVGEDFAERQGVQEMDLVVMGHTHVPLVEKSGDTLVVNPGSVGQPRDGDPRASFAVVDMESMDAEIRRVEYDVEPVVERVSDSELPASLGERLEEGR
ncbi:MAG: metallophosphoesterase [Candidatus Nanohaloarchaea archaeon]